MPAKSHYNWASVETKSTKGACVHTLKGGGVRMYEPHFYYKIIFRFFCIKERKKEGENQRDNKRMSNYLLVCFSYLSKTIVFCYILETL